MVSQLFTLLLTLLLMLSKSSGQVGRNGISVEQIDHFIIAVNNVTETTSFYSRVFNARIKQILIKVLPTDSTYTPRAHAPTPGSADVCLVIHTDLTSATQYLQNVNVTLIQGRGGRPGALGTLQSIYFRDPDGNLLEVANYNNEPHNSDVRQGIQVDRLDHFVITATNQRSTIDFYDNVFDIRRTQWEIRFGAQKMNVHQRGREFSPHAEPVIVGSANICLVTTIPLTECINHIEQLNISVEYGPVDNTGATGAIRSVYFRDPNQNLIQLSNRVGNQENATNPNQYVTTSPTTNHASQACVSEHIIPALTFLITCTCMY